MNNLNQILLEGNLTRDPEFKTTANGTSLCTFSIATNRYGKKKDDGTYEQEVSFFDITAWAALAETCSKQLHKGRGVRVIGRLKQDRWTDPETQQQRSKVHVIAEHVVFKPEAAKKASEPKTEAAGDEEVPF